ncbi:MAG: hypothetical protein JSS67_11445 [Bacteroidetes bacterium]|nr:hypothetical protein [Bacteroidota bacterium]
MKTSVLLCLLGIGLFISSCHKTSFVDNSSDDGTYGFAQNTSDFRLESDTICIPINEMYNRTYFGYHGGFYPNRGRVPSGQYATDLDSINGTIFGLDTAGNRVNKAGQIVIGGVGACLSGAPVNGLRRRKNNPNTIQNINYVNFEFGGASFEHLADPNSTYWQHVDEKMSSQNTTYKQVQMLWICTDDSSSITDWPTRPLIAKESIKAAARTLKIKFPNLKILYMIGRPYTWDMSDTLGKISNVRSRNPAPYHQGWAEKWAIEDQINGDPGVAYKGPNAVAPIMTWASYQWTQGKKPNADGFAWYPSDTRDGLHPTDAGKDKLAQFLWNFLYNDPYTTKWFLRH